MDLPAVAGPRVSPAYPAGAETRRHCAACEAEKGRPSGRYACQDTQNHVGMKKNALSVKTRQQVAAEYGVHVSTLLRWLDRREIRLPSGMIYPRDLQRIYAALGNPQPHPG